MTDPKTLMPILQALMMSQGQQGQQTAPPKPTPPSPPASQPLAKPPVSKGK